MKGKAELLKAFDVAVESGAVKRLSGAPDGAQLSLHLGACRYKIRLQDTPEGIAARRKALERQAGRTGHTSSYVECQRALAGHPRAGSICYGPSEPVQEDKE